MITLKQKGDFSKLSNYLERIKHVVNLSKLDEYGRQGVLALKSATPVDTGLTADSWDYYITQTKDSVSITFTNSNNQNGVPVAILLQYGHATKNGGYVQGIDYVNPALKPLFNKMAEEAWEEVTRV